MKYAFMSFSAPRLSLGELLALAKHLGYDGIEPRIDANQAHGVELATSAAQRQQIRAQAAASGVTLCCIATGCKYADPAAAAAAIEQTRRCIALAADVGAPRLRVFGGQIPADVNREAAAASVVAALHAVADEAQASGVTVCLETHDDWTDPQQVAAIMRAVDHPAIAVNWDYQHTTRIARTTVDEAFATLRPWVRHVHFHDGENRADTLVFLPVGQGGYDNRRVVELLIGAGYDGYLSGEWIDWEPYEIHLPRELAAMRGIEQGLLEA